MMKRLDRVEHAIAQVATILVEQSERIDSVRGELREVRGEIQSTREALSERLDRLIAVTMQERTLGIERLAEIERRLARLEHQAGF
jgi:hypothetical protein